LSNLNTEQSEHFLIHHGSEFEYEILVTNL